AFHPFFPQGVSGVVVIAESHLTIHTWPELGYAAIDVFTCGDEAYPEKACQYLLEHFKCQRHTLQELKRGTFPQQRKTPSILTIASPELSKQARG
ncbi:MAG: adenosylmethionine decarboxylase, partial [Myxococcota bacterium]